MNQVQSTVRSVAVDTRHSRLRDEPTIRGSLACTTVRPLLARDLPLGAPEEIRRTQGVSGVFHGSLQRTFGRSFDVQRSQAQVDWV